MDAGSDFAKAVLLLYQIQLDLDWPYVKPSFKIKVKKWMNDLDAVNTKGGRGPGQRQAPCAGALSACIG